MRCLWVLRGLCSHCYILISPALCFLSRFVLALCLSCLDQLLGSVLLHVFFSFCILICTLTHSLATVHLPLLNEAISEQLSGNGHFFTIDRRLTPGKCIYTNFRTHFGNLCPRSGCFPCEQRFLSDDTPSYSSPGNCLIPIVTQLGKVRLRGYKSDPEL